MSKRYAFPSFVSIVDSQILHLRTFNISPPYWHIPENGVNTCPQFRSEINKFASKLHQSAPKSPNQPRLIHHPDPPKTQGKRSSRNTISTLFQIDPHLTTWFLPPSTTTNRSIFTANHSPSKVFSHLHQSAAPGFSFHGFNSSRWRPSPPSLR
jgi:hypothetical protein